MTLTRGTRRRLRTVLFTDIVGSTEMAAQLGDRRWRQVIARHHEAVRRALKQHRGRELDTAGDGFFASFEDPTDAVRCAASAVAAVHGLGLRIRAAIHTGEVESLPDGKVGGIAVHIGARLLAMAELEQVLVSSTVRDLVAGSGLEFADLGVHALRGVPGEWHVHSLVLPRLDESVALASTADDGAVPADRRRTLLAAGAIVTVLVVGASLAGAALLAPRERPRATGPDSVVAFDRATGAIVAGERVGRDPEALAVGAGSVWVASVGAGTVTRVDPATGVEGSFGQVGARPTSLAIVEDRLWVADRFGGQISILEAESGELVSQIATHVTALSPGSSSVWGVDDLGDRVMRFDSRSMLELETIALPPASGPVDVAATASATWIAAPRSGTLLRLDADGGDYVSPSLAFEGIEVVAAHEDAIWIASPSTDVVARIAPTELRILVRIDVCDTPIALAPEASGAWIACATERALWHVDGSGSLLGRYELDGVPTDVALDGGRVWVTLRSD